MYWIDGLSKRITLYWKMPEIVEGEQTPLVQKQKNVDPVAIEKGCTSFWNGLFCFLCLLTGQFFVDLTTLQEPEAVTSGHLSLYRSTEENGGWIWTMYIHKYILNNIYFVAN